MNIIHRYSILPIGGYAIEHLPEPTPEGYRYQVWQGGLTIGECRNLMQARSVVLNHACEVLQTRHSHLQAEMHEIRNSMVLLHKTTVVPYGALNYFREKPPIEELIERALATPMTPEMIREQRISWVYGNLPKGNKLTREEVACMIDNHNQEAGSD